MQVVECKHIFGTSFGYTTFIFKWLCFCDESHIASSNDFWKKTTMLIKNNVDKTIQVDKFGHNNGLYTQKGWWEKSKTMSMNDISLSTFYKTRLRRNAKLFRKRIVDLKRTALIGDSSDIHIHTWDGYALCCATCSDVHIVPH